LLNRGLNVIEVGCTGELILDWARNRVANRIGRSAGILCKDLDYRKIDVRELLLDESGIRDETRNKRQQHDNRRKRRPLYEERGEFIHCA
jgi:hypothetical protein